MPNLLLTAALDYADLGWKIVPLHDLAGGKCSCGRDTCGNSAGKHPRLKEWQNAASSDPATIERWWGMWPRANVGVKLGSGSGIVGVDIDPPHGETVLAELAAGDLPDTLEMRTGKGRRLLYAIPDGIEVEPRTQVIEGPDGTEGVRLQGGATGAQCVVPPSSHYSGNAYAWVVGSSPADREPAPMPGWCLAEMCRPEAAPAISDAGSIDAHAPGAYFNRRGDWWADVLLPIGAKPAGRRGDVQYVTRPGKEGGVSASIGHYKAKDGTPALYIWSGNFPALRQGKCYDLFGAFARLLFNRDYAAAAKALAAKGYGTPRPSGSRPAAVASSPPPPAEWPPPVPLGETTSVPPFPLRPLPRPLANYILAVAEATGTPPDYAGCILLGMASGLIGATLAARLQPGPDGWTERPLLYLCIVADPSAGKTPAQMAVEKPAYRASAAAGGPPTFITDTTVEALVPLLKKRPRGVTLTVDEFSGWYGSFNQYKPGGKGSDKDFWLSCWTGKSWTVARKNFQEGFVSVSHPFTSVLGGTQPDRLPLLVDRDDGFLERVLWNYADPLKPRTSRAGIDGSVWEQVAQQLLARDMTECERHPDGRPYYLELTRDAADLFFDDWCAAMDAAAAEDGGRLKGTYPKLKGYAARLAVLCFALRKASGGSVSEITGDDMAGGIEYARFFLGHARRARAATAADPRTRLAVRVIDWAARKQIQTFARTELHLALRDLVTRPEDWADPLRLLVQFNWLRYQDQGPIPTGPGRRPTPRYEVHPNAAEMAQSRRKQTPINSPESAINCQAEAGEPIDCAKKGID